MYDLEVAIDNDPRRLALLGETLGRTGIGVEGGGMFTVDGRGVAHFLVANGFEAADVLSAAGMKVTACTEVLTTRLAQNVPGQLGAFCRTMADAGVSILVLYSDHDGNLILLVDDPETGKEVTDAWLQKARHR